MDRENSIGMQGIREGKRSKWKRQDLQGVEQH